METGESSTVIRETQICITLVAWLTILEIRGTFRPRDPVEDFTGDVFFSGI